MTSSTVLPVLIANAHASATTTPMIASCFFLMPPWTCGCDAGAESVWVSVSTMSLPYLGVARRATRFVADRAVPPVCGGTSGDRGMTVAVGTVVRSLLVASVLGCSMFACATAKQTVPTSAPSTSAARLAWLSAEVARAEQLNHRMRGSYVPQGSPGAASVCSLAIQIDSWYGVADERWELVNASSMMMPARGPLNIREELARIGIRDCVLDIDR